MTDTRDIVTWLRDFTGPGSNRTNEAADTIEALRAKCGGLSLANGGWSVKFAQVKRERDAALAALESIRTALDDAQISPSVRGEFVFAVLNGTLPHAATDHLADARAEAWWEGVNDQWKHRPIGNRMSEFDNPYTILPTAASERGKPRQHDR